MAATTPFIFAPLFFSRLIPSQPLAICILLEVVCVLSEPQFLLNGRLTKWCRFTGIRHINLSAVSSTLELKTCQMLLLLLLFHPKRKGGRT